jgi:DNA-binding response OmpR family regulator
MEIALERDGCDVVPASDGVAALELLCEVGPDVIIADLDGRDLDGLLLCQVRGSLRAHATLPVLVLTEAGPDTHPARARVSLDNVRIIQKPVDPATIATAVSQMTRMAPARLPRSSQLPHWERPSAA